METIEVFVQGEGHRRTEVVRVRPEATVAELVEEARKVGLPTDNLILVVENTEHQCEPRHRLADAGIGHHTTVHCHRCAHIELTVNYQAGSKHRSFSPGVTLAQVMEWAEKVFDLTPDVAAGFALQVSNTDDRPSPQTHVGSLASYPNCSVTFDLVSKERVQG